MNRTLRSLGVLLVCMSLAGCAQWHQEGVGLSTLQSSIGGGVSWLHEVRMVQQMPVVDQPGQLDVRRQAFRDDPRPEKRMRLVLLRALGADSVRNEAAALALMAELDRTGLDSDLVTLVELLQQSLQEKAQTGARVAAERKLLQERDQRISELEQQLEALTSIEQSIKQRQKAHQGVTP